MKSLKSQLGYAVIVDPDAPTAEYSTVTCGHCQFACMVKAGCDPSDLGGFCRVCFRYVCKSCNKEGTCKPFEKQIEQMEARGVLLRSMGLGDS